MNFQEILEYLCELLNINLKNKLVSDKILMTLKDMSVSYDLIKFGDFLESSFNYERFRYLTGYQKFLSMANEFKRDNKLELSEEMQTKALTYSQDLFKKVTAILDEVNFELQIKSKTIDDLNLEQTLIANGLEKHHIRVLQATGSKETIFAMAIYGKDELSRRIESIVNKKAMIKSYPQLAAPKKEKIQVLERLKNAK